ncbi:MAG: hypothetical protein MUF42_08890 [Cytophagaceae bacterium]|jgi:hypothetical protein|nr:hypothetical protein [Cytophagaceae bacterium]
MKLSHVAFVSLAALLVLAGCKKIKDLLTFDMNYSTSFNIPGAIATNTALQLTTPDVPTNSEATFKSKKTATNLVKSITLKSCELQVTLPDTADYDFLKLVELYINAEGLSETKIASKLNVPVNPGRTLVLDAEGTNLMSFIKKDKFSLKIRYQADETVLTQVSNNVNMVFEVSATPQ